MAVTDNYVVQYLLQATSDHGANHDGCAIWNQIEGGFRTKIRDVEIELDVVPSRAGERIYLSLTYTDHRMWIAEPPDSGLLAPHYENADEAMLASMLRSLVRYASRQCLARESHWDEAEDGARAVIVQHLLFGDEHEAPPVPEAGAEAETRTEVQI